VSDFTLGKQPLVVGSLASAATLRGLDLLAAAAACDVVEVRLDGLFAEGTEPQPALWDHLREFPLLFTARRSDEGGAGKLAAGMRAALLHDSLNDAAMVDVEVASIREMGDLRAELADRKLPWVASFHDFQGPSTTAPLAAARDLAAEAGAAVFKAAVTLTRLDDLLAMAAFQAAPAPIPVAMMGMGPLAPVSRLLCAQLGSPLNYGYLGTTPTAPGQWSAALLHAAIRHSARLH
jgi:3-dehydroquinate dehydratase I